MYDMHLVNSIKKPYTLNTSSIYWQWQNFRREIKFQNNSSHFIFKHFWRRKNI